MTAVDFAGPSTLDKQQCRCIPSVGGLNAEHSAEIGIDSIITGADHKLLATLDLKMDSDLALVQARQARARLEVVGRTSGRVFGARGSGRGWERHNRWKGHYKVADI
jgi:hypothetical protein